MKIVTVNLPKLQIETIRELTGDKALYPSRSELIRVAVRDFLIKELKIAKNYAHHTVFTPRTQVECPEEEDAFVFVPNEVKVGNSVIRDFKRYRIVDRSEKFAKI